jgi:hypothetical protein
MTLPCTPTVEIRLGTGAGFGDVLVLGDPEDGILGTNVLGTNVIQVANISSLVTRISIRRGRDRMFEQYSPGQAVVQFQDFTGDWNPDNSSSPYYGQILPMRQVKIHTTYSGTTYNLFTGFITSWDWNWADQAADYALVTIQLIDAFRLFQLSEITTVTGAATNDLPGTRINQILDQINWSEGLRAISTGETELQNDPGTSRTALAALQNIEQSDLGALFIDADGYATYLSRADLAQRAAGTATQFSDTDPADIAYQNLDINLDETELANQVTFTRLGGTAQTASDATSIEDYFLRSYSRDGLMMKDNGSALVQANLVLAYRKTPRLRVDSITLDLSSVSSRVPAGLGLDIGDPIVVERDMANGTGFDVRVTINGINHDITPDRWTTRFSTAYPLSTAFILNSAQFGILGTNTL